ncbi:unnamed protein product, partial [Prorocentrum cordatum]
EWVQAPSGLGAEMARQGLAARPDSRRVAVAGQSSGNHVVGAALTRGCGLAKAWVMIDPVDGFDPYRIVKSEDLITPGQKLNFTLPSLLLDNGLDPKSSNALYPPCAPEVLSNDRFYNAMRGPIWAVRGNVRAETLRGGCIDARPPMYRRLGPDSPSRPGPCELSMGAYRRSVDDVSPVCGSMFVPLSQSPPNVSPQAVNATEYGHLDCCDTQGSLCPTNSSTDKAAYKETIVAAAAAFLGALFGQRPSSDLQLLEDPSFFNVSVLLKHNYNGASRSSVAPGCVNHAPEVPPALVV